MEASSRAPRQTVDVSVAIPAYSRSLEMAELLESIYQQSVLPAEITICEDNSPQREQIRAIVAEWTPRFAQEFCSVNYVENECNLGYDGNVRKVIGVSHASWVMLMGNDDLVLPGCLETVAAFTCRHPDISMVSRSFVIFEGGLSRRLGSSQLALEDQVFTAGVASSGMIMRTCGFVGGLVLDRKWAIKNATEKYDGSLYYQIYLAAVAFCQSGIGYISRSIVASRAGNPPLFGSAASEQGIHVPGSYTPLGRAQMWASILRISEDVGRRFGVHLVPGMKTELEIRQSFHIFEMMAGAGRPRLAELRREFEKLGLFGHPVPRALYVVDLILGSRAKLFFRAVRVGKGIISKVRGLSGMHAPGPGQLNGRHLPDGTSVRGPVE
jgi:glycosyltransferase involved in cell wall biosynthesis